MQIRVIKHIRKVYGCQAAKQHRSPPTNPRN